MGIGLPSVAQSSRVIMDNYGQRRMMSRCHIFIFYSLRADGLTARLQPPQSDMYDSGQERDTNT